MSNGALVSGKFWFPIDTTNWYPKEITPFYEGVYRTQIVYDSRIMFGYSMWSNNLWGPQVASREEAAKYPANPQGCNVGLKNWKGLAFDPYANHIKPDTLHAQVLRDISVELGMSEQAVSKVALATYQMIYEKAKLGQRVAFTDKKGKLVLEPIHGLPVVV